MKKAKTDFMSSDEVTTLTPKQLDKKSKELDGKQFHSIFHVSEVSEDSLEAAEKEGKWSKDFSLDFDGDYDLRKYVKENDIVEIIGVVDCGFFGGIIAGIDIKWFTVRMSCVYDSMFGLQNSCSLGAAIKLYSKNKN